MTKTGKAVVISPRSNPADKGYYQIFRNDTILMLIPDVACAALEWDRWTVENFVSLGKHNEFEEYNGSN